MKKRVVCVSRVLLVFAMLLAASAVAAGDLSGQWYRVRWVNDGDTIVLSNGQRVRYLGINTPEIAHEDQKAEPLGEAAKSFNRKMVAGKRVRLELDRESHDRYNRLLAYVFLEDGTFVNAALVEKGYAYCLYKKPNTKYHSELLTRQRRAMKAGRGFWRQESLRRSGVYPANKKSKRFHRKSCRFGKKIRSANRTIFHSRWEAFHAGFAPCSKCL